MTPPFRSTAATAPSVARWTSMLIFAEKMSAPWSHTQKLSSTFPEGGFTWQDNVRAIPSSEEEEWKESAKQTT